MSKSQFPITFETFRCIDGYQQAAITLDEPAAYNGLVQVKRYRVTVEEIEEPDEVICSRLQRLWDECKNHHVSRDLARYAKQYNYQFKVKS